MLQTPVNIEEMDLVKILEKEFTMDCWVINLRLIEIGI